MWASSYSERSLNFPTTRPNMGHGPCPLSSRDTSLEPFVSRRRRTLPTIYVSSRLFSFSTARSCPAPLTAAFLAARSRSSGRTLDSPDTGENIYNCHNKVITRCHARFSPLPKEILFPQSLELQRPHRRQRTSYATS